ncbi:MAG: hypothetical protein LQ345_003360, partial [Seirophora villosa]
TLSIAMADNNNNAVDQVHHDTPSNPSANPDCHSSPFPSPFPSPSPSPSPSLPQLRPSSDDMDLETPVRPSMTRVSSTASTPLRHPTPDLQSLQGAYLANIERLELSAERLSMSGSDIGEELRKIRMEQKRSESRRSSLINTRSVDDDPHSSSRQRSYGPSASNSIAGINSLAKSGAFSPEAYLASPRGSIRSGSWSRRNSAKARSTSNASRFAQMLDSNDLPASPTKAVTDFSPAIPPPKPLDEALMIKESHQSHAATMGDSSATPPLPQATPEPAPIDLPRPSSADTYRRAQAAGLFADFAGVHAATHDTTGDSQATQDEVRPRQSSNRISSAGRPKSFLEPVPGENMVYYPAPVPMMLNLPQKLSKQPRHPHIDKRRSAMLSGLDPNARKSAVWLPDVVEGEDAQPIEESEPAGKANNRRKTVGELPSQLRASLFFDYPSAPPQDIEVKGGSAVETLDSILDASAFAPVSAFTDHPIAGCVGKEVYGRPLESRRASYIPLEEPEVQGKRSSVNLLKKRNSNPNVLEDSQTRRSSLLSLGFGRRKSSAPQLADEADHLGPLTGPLPSEVTPLRDGDEGPAALEEGEGDFFDAQSHMDGERADEESELIGAYSGAPTTLLAELQLRKEQQKQRNRTAATAFPDGMHSTLLELDTVAQIQKQARTKKHTHLAWEDPDAQHAGAEDDDEDVPLGVLFPSRIPKANGHGGRNDNNKPLGLIARREMEDNEPLSHRRARLRGEPSIRRTPSPDRKGTMYTLDLPGLQTESTQQGTPNEDDDEGETLAQRLKRLKATRVPNNNRTVSGDFASEIMSHFGGLEDPKKQPSPSNNKNNNNASPEPEEEETLAQRRARLQAAKHQSRNASGETSNGTTRLAAMNKRRSMADLLQAHPAAGAGINNNWTVSTNNEKALPLPSSAAPKTPWTMQVQQRALSGAEVPPAATNGMVRKGVPNPLLLYGEAKLGGGPDGGGGVGEVRNRDMVDRWRQSVLY